MSVKLFVIASLMPVIAACTGVQNIAPADDDADARAIVDAVVDPADFITRMADRFYELSLQRSPEIAYFSGVELERHDGLYNNHPAAQREAEADVDEMLRLLAVVDVQALLGKPEWITYSYLFETLTSSVATRVCRSELWNVNQMGGWHSGYSQIAQLQPVGTRANRQQSLARWSKFDAFVSQEIANLRDGLRLGYSAPKPVVQRVIDQLDGILALDVEDSPFYSPAKRDGNAAFARATKKIVINQIVPAVQAYRDYLADTYIASARDALSVTANPNGTACYEASLRQYTTLQRSGKEVYELGKETVEGNKQVIVEMGQRLYGTTDFAEILRRTKNNPDDKFASADELLSFSKDMVLRAEREMPNWVGNMPAQPVVVVPFEKFEEGTGRSAHYNPASADRPGEYRIPLHNPQEQSRGNAEATAFHETWPGHHLQVAVSQSVAGLHPITQIVWFSGPGEGWARYSEALAEEMGLYATTSGPILRRAWPARGMVVDPGIHLFGWTRQQAIDFMMISGRFPESKGDEMVDRIAILPGQLTAYDSGGLEILALRKMAEQRLGDDFDIREFHDRVLENGTIPLTALRQHIERWLAGRQ